jgi:hypothetical protein
MTFFCPKNKIVSEVAKKPEPNDSAKTMIMLNPTKQKV